MNEFYSQAESRLNNESLGRFDKYGEVMKQSVKEALLDFCRQDDEFAQAIVQGGSFKDCMAAVAKKIKGNAISDIDAYKAAVEFYFPGAAVSVSMSINLCGESAHAADEESGPSKGKVLDLSAFF